MTGGLVLCGLEQFYGVAVWVFQLNLFAAWPYFHLISKVYAVLFKVGNTGR